MPLRRAYEPLLPKFDAFLFASVGEEVNGIPLSVLSLFSQLGLDPRDEAARLSCLNESAAAEELAGMIERATKDRWTGAEARTVADGLIWHLRQTVPVATIPEPQRAEATPFGALKQWYARQLSAGAHGGLGKGQAALLAVIAAAVLYVLFRL